jgi:hypothetical protein
MPTTVRHRGVKVKDGLPTYQSGESDESRPACRRGGAAGELDGTAW